MKSDREFIDGIYEKAKHYTTEENSTSLTTYKRKTVRPYVWQTLSCAAAMLLLCVAIDGINGKEDILQRNRQGEPTAAVQEMGVALARFMSEPEVQTVTGKVLLTMPEKGYFLLEVEKTLADEEIQTVDTEEATTVVIQILYDPVVYDIGKFEPDETISVDVLRGDAYGLLTDLFENNAYPLYTLQ